MTVVVATIIALTLRDVVPLSALLAWWCVVLVVALFRLGLVSRYQHRAPDSTVAWHRLMTVATAFSGMTWGAAGILFFIPGSELALIAITITLAGMTAGSVPSHSSWLPAQVVYAVPTMTPIAVRYLINDGELWIMGILCLIYMATMLAYARKLSRTLVESIRLRLEKQELVQRAEQARTRAEEASLAKSRFLAAASHDLRQPLHAVNLFLEALRNEPDPARAETVLDHLGASAQALEDLLNELLDISKLEAGLFHAQRYAIPLQGIFAALERELRPVAEAKGIELNFVPTRLMVMSDPHMLGRILRNIITNAIRYTEQGAVLVGCRRRGARVAIAVCDTGPGIAPEHHQAIFREFYQLGNPERDRRKGLGLGLAIVDGLCRALDHPLELRSRVGKGSTFSVHVPITTVEAVLPLDVTEESGAELHGCAVLVIDDEPVICQAMTDLLSRWGCRVLTAEGASEAMVLLASSGFWPDVILADYRLRGGSTGTQAIAEVRRLLDQEVPAAILTGDTDPERLREASASGFLLLHKPVRPARLRAAIGDLRRAGPARDGLA